MLHLHRDTFSHYHFYFSPHIGTETISQTNGTLEQSLFLSFIHFYNLFIESMAVKSYMAKEMFHSNSFSHSFVYCLFIDDDNNVLSFSQHFFYLNYLGFLYSFLIQIQKNMNNSLFHDHLPIKNRFIPIVRYCLNLFPTNNGQHT